MGAELLGAMDAKSTVEVLAVMRPEDAARRLALLPVQQAAALMSAMDEHRAGARLAELRSPQAVAVLCAMTTEVAASRLFTMDTAAAAELLQAMPPETAAAIIGASDTRAAKAVVGALPEHCRSDLIFRMPPAQAARHISWARNAVEKESVLRLVPLLAQISPAEILSTLQWHTAEQAAQAINALPSDSLPGLLALLAAALKYEDPQPVPLLPRNFMRNAADYESDPMGMSEFAMLFRSPADESLGTLTGSEPRSATLLCNLHAKRMSSALPKLTPEQASAILAGVPESVAKQWITGVESASDAWLQELGEAFTQGLVKAHVEATLDGRLTNTLTDGAGRVTATMVKSVPASRLRSAVRSWPPALLCDVIARSDDDALVVIISTVPAAALIRVLQQQPPAVRAITFSALAALADGAWSKMTMRVPLPQSVGRRGAASPTRRPRGKPEDVAPTSMALFGNRTSDESQAAWTVAEVLCALEPAHAAPLLHVLTKRHTAAAALCAMPAGQARALLEGVPADSLREIAAEPRWGAHALMLMPANIVGSVLEASSEPAAHLCRLFGQGTAVMAAALQEMTPEKATQLLWTFRKAVIAGQLTFPAPQPGLRSIGESPAVLEYARRRQWSAAVLDILVLSPGGGASLLAAMTADRRIEEFVNDVPSEAIARLLAGLPPNRSTADVLLRRYDAGRVVAQLEPPRAQALLHHLSAVELGHVLAGADTDKRVELLLALPYSSVIAAIRPMLKRMRQQRRWAKSFREKYPDVRRNR